MVKECFSSPSASSTCHTCRVDRRMETNNRFALLSTQEEREEQQEDKDPPVAIQTKKTKTKDISTRPTERHSWEIPDFISRSIPISTPLAEIEEDKPSEGKQSFEENSPEELSSMTSVVTPLPPQHHKFNLHRHSQSLIFSLLRRHRNSSHLEQTSPSTLSKFSRQPSLLPKHGSVRGNSKASTHQI